MKKILFLIIILTTLGLAQETTIYGDVTITGTLTAGDTTVGGGGVLPDSIVYASELTPYATKTINFLGAYAGAGNTGLVVTGIGLTALNQNTGSYSVGLGTDALYQNAGDYNTGVGYKALQQNGSPGGYNINGAYVGSGGVTGVGAFALWNNQTGGATGVGAGVLQYNTGFVVQALGAEAGMYNTGGCADFFGFRAGFANTGGDGNAFGDDALFWNTGLMVSGIGTYALKNNEGGYNSAFGSQAFNKFTADTPNEITFDSSAITGQKFYLPAHGLGDDSTYVLLKYTMGTDTIAGMSDEDIEIYRAIYKFRIVTEDTIEAYGWSLPTSPSVTNGVFTDSTGWDVGEHWSIDGGVATYDGSGTWSVLSQSNFLTTGRTYIVSFDVTNASASSEMHVYMGGGGESEMYQFFPDGSYADTLIADGTGLTFGSGGSYALSIDNIVITDLETGALGSGHKLTPQVIYTNSTALGYDAEPTASNQIMLGNTNVTSVVTSGNIISNGDSVLTMSDSVSVYATKTVTDSLAEDIADLPTTDEVKDIVRDSITYANTGVVKINATASGTISEDAYLPIYAGDGSWRAEVVANLPTDADAVNVLIEANEDTTGVESAYTMDEIDSLLALVGKVQTHTITTDSTLAAGLMYGGIFYVTEAQTITLPAVAEGMNAVFITVGNVAVSIDVNGSDLMYLDGTALSDGDKATNTSTTGDMIVFTYFSSVGWYATSGSNDGDRWTDGN